jgi:hypothetical protein
MELSSSSDTPFRRVDIASWPRKESTAATARSTAWLWARRITSKVICGVTFGLPSRSPPIHDPKRRGVDQASEPTIECQSSSTSGTAPRAS